MLLAGVIGNMYDRLHFGYVRDMIHGLPGVYWPDWIIRMLPAAMAPLLRRTPGSFPLDLQRRRLLAVRRRRQP